MAEAMAARIRRMREATEESRDARRMHSSDRGRSALKLSSSLTGKLAASGFPRR